MNNQFFICFLILLNIHSYVTSEILLYSNRQLCKNDEYFNSLSFRCLKCDSNKYLQPAHNGKLEQTLFYSVYSILMIFI